jgi:hypothetical protein
MAIGKGCAAFFRFFDPRRSCSILARVQGARHCLPMSRIEPENQRVVIMPEVAGEAQKMKKTGRRGQIRLPVWAEG